MSIRKIKLWPDPILRKISQPIQTIDKYIQKIGCDLVDSVIAHNAAGLAAPQIGINLRIFVINSCKDLDQYLNIKKPEIFINPFFLPLGDKFKWEEGCLSIPQKFGQVSRFKKINIKYQAIDGTSKSLIVSDFLSGCFQHELDHLDGILWIDA
ncbi:MAG: peptide deformylase [Deltaproteobacteria bacterium]|nr:MAG: peptide deformylase [Deltaproteobacteria bacterium]